MNNKEIYMKAESFDDFQNQMPYYSDDFQAVDEQSGQKYDKASWFATGKQLQDAFPDLKNFNDEIKEEGDQLLVTSHWEGTFTNPFDLSMLGMGVIQPSGKKVVFPPAKVRHSFKDGKITRSVVLNTGPEAGFAGILKALGVSMPG
jgi:hypothetical protein